MGLKHRNWKALCAKVIRRDDYRCQIRGADCTTFADTITRSGHGWASVCGPCRPHN